MEIWKDIKGYEGLYQVSSEGRVRSIDRKKTFLRKGKLVSQTWIGQIIKSSAEEDRYLKLNLCKDGVKKLVNVHRVVAETFITRESLDLEVNHKDGNKKNNNVDNLEWVTHYENIRHSINTGLKKTRTNTKKEKIIKEHLENKNVSDKYIADKVNASRNYVYQVRKRVDRNNIY